MLKHLVMATKTPSNSVKLQSLFKFVFFLKENIVYKYFNPVSQHQFCLFRFTGVLSQPVESAD